MLFNWFFKTDLYFCLMPTIRMCIQLDAFLRNVVQRNVLTELVALERQNCTTMNRKSMVLPHLRPTSAPPAKQAFQTNWPRGSARGALPSRPRTQALPRGEEVPPGRNLTTSGELPEEIIDKLPAETCTRWDGLWRGPRTQRAGGPFSHHSSPPLPKVPPPPRRQPPPRDCRETGIP